VRRWVHELARVLLLLVVTICKCSINPINNPNPAYSHSYTWQRNVSAVITSRLTILFPKFLIQIPLPSALHAVPIVVPLYFISITMQSWKWLVTDKCDTSIPNIEQQFPPKRQVYQYSGPVTRHADHNSMCPFQLRISITFCKMMCSTGAENSRQTNYTAVAIKQVSVKKACDRTDGNHAAILLLLRQEAMATKGRTKWPPTRQ
jgi:hypothetical protein